mmetsp:Transcript_3512/g.5145  ORF Transcript_3512/g.5145 Transcript_3512/m.5145 type:complete len:122 (-) Transcript_3512:373-738(-)
MRFLSTMVQVAPEEELPLTPSAATIPISAVSTVRTSLVLQKLCQYEEGEEVAAVLLLLVVMGGGGGELGKGNLAAAEQALLPPSFFCLLAKKGSDSSSPTRSAPLRQGIPIIIVLVLSVPS